MFFNYYIRTAKISEINLIFHFLNTFLCYNMQYLFFAQQIKEFFPYKPTFEQEKSIKKLSEFFLTAQERGTLVLKGYAGTGKTTLMAAFVKTLVALHQKVVLLAPTGRSAKVFSSYAGLPAYTIHKKIYREKSFTGEGGRFVLNDNLHKHTLLIIDEASMIANDGLTGTMFGSGYLLDDLISYVYSGEGCRLILMGDTAQLPPVGEDFSPALDVHTLLEYGLQVMELEMKEVVRQQQESGILWNATRLRELIEQERFDVLPKFRLEGFSDVRVVMGEELIDVLSDCYDQDGQEDTLVICRSNKRANIYNRGIRGRILWREEELESGDRVMVTKNNYYWTEGNTEMEFIANGDMAQVVRVRGDKELYGFHFVEVTLSFPDHDYLELDVNLLLDTLQSDAPSLSHEESEKLYQQVMEDYAHISPKRERIKKLKSDPYFNALQVKYAYAVTCHKAQGGQWKNVFIDQAYLSPEYLTSDFFRWLYTATTRATGTLYLVNYPE